MSTDPLNPQQGEPGQPAPSASLVRRRAASVKLREAEAVGRPEDQANEALGDALKVVYRFLQVGMLVLVGVFLLSGFQSVREGERGVRVLLGRVTDDDLKPGFQWSIPRPLGEIVKIDIGNKSAEIREEFWPNQASADQRFAADSVLANQGRGKLDPIQDGMLLLGDLSIAHATAKVEYVRRPEEVRQFTRNVHPDAERGMVKAAIMQGLIKAAAGVTIDQFRKDLGVQRDAQQHAQAMLDKVGSGLQIKSLVLERRMVPTNLIKIFSEVDNAIAKGEEEKNKAGQERQSKLAQAAGDAAEDVLRLIDLYDQQLAGGKTAEAEATLALLDRLLDGEPVGESGLRPGARVAGAVSRMLSSARAERSRAVNRAQSDAQLFAAKFETFRTSPGVVLTSDWTDATGRFRNRDSVQTFLVPPGVRTLELLLNRDPEVQKEQERLRNQQLRQQREAEELQKAIDAGLAAP